MIFAAGFGTRMGAATRNRPKPLLNVAGRPLIDHALGMARDAGAGPIVVNTHYLAEQIAEHLAPQNVTISPEFPEILDTGGGLRHALPLLGTGPVMTLNADAVFTGPNPLGFLRSRWDAGIMGALLLLVPPNRAIGHDLVSGFCMNGTAALTRGTELAYTGVQILHTDLLRDIPDRVFSLNRVWDMMIDQGRLFGALYPGSWCDVGHPEGLRLAEQMLKATDV